MALSVTTQDLAMQGQTMRAQMADISTSISWGMLAQTYFDKSASWFYHKLNGIDGNGKPTQFSLEEKEQLQGALFDLSNRIRKAAEGII